MLDLKWILDNPELFDNNMDLRGIDIRADRIIKLDKIRREKLTELQSLQHRRNQLSEEIGNLKSRGEDCGELGIEVNDVNTRISAIKNMLEGGENYELRDILSLIPNVLQDSVPRGKDDSDNVTIEMWSEPRKFDFQPKPHDTIGEKLNQMDFEQVGNICGGRSTALFDGLARLERALSNFFLDEIGKYGYRETSIPFLVKSKAMFGTGNLPKFSEDAYCVAEDMWLIPTSEVTMTNWVADRIIEEKDLPLRLTAYSPCWRSEAGSAGRDTRGMFRQHQFKKVEMVSVTTPAQSNEEHERMNHIESELLKTLGLPFRVMLLCSGDTGFSSSKTYDHEVWLPAQNTYREISSCSNCTDFQARRMNARYRNSQKKLEFVHTLNGSALAIGRTIIAIVENYQRKDGSVEIPSALQPYMGNLEIIDKSDLFI
ncbi:MAG: serine--tRNA ligase [Rickettsiales bacterium]|jgi:seryl-tRNA synthetase|nr:serine--tRNA ligase [Rickettsiales bacterium]